MTSPVEHMGVRPIRGHEPVQDAAGAFSEYRISVAANPDEWLQLREDVARRLARWRNAGPGAHETERPVLRYASDGGGVQSTAIKRMVDAGVLGPEPDVYIFSDTRYESSSVYEQLRELHDAGGNRRVRVPLIVVSGGDLYTDQAVDRAGGGRSGGRNRFAALPFFTKAPHEAKEGRVRRQCTSEYKIEVVYKAVRMLLGLPYRARFPRLGAPYVEQWLGISLDEIQRAKTSVEHWLRIEHPLIDAKLTRTQCLDWLKEHGFDRPARSACIGCPLRGPEEWLDLLERHPQEFESACQFDEAIRHAAGMGRPCFVHRSCVPLREVDIAGLAAAAREKRENRESQGSLWTGCESGWCGT